MPAETTAGRNGTHPQQLEVLAKQISYLRTIVMILAGAVVFIFGGGVAWTRFYDRLQQYERTVDAHGVKVVELDEKINTLKIHLGELKDPSYQTEATEEQEAGRCQEGHVATGIRFDRKENRIWVRCASLGRAAWNPGGGVPYQKQ